MRYWWMVGVCFLAAGCATPSTAVDDQSAEDGPRPVVVQTGRSPAPWLEEPVDGETPRVHEEIVARGQNCAVVTVAPLRVGYLGVCEGDERVRVLEVPEETQWVGLGTDDSLLVADTRGQLHAGTIAEGLEEKRAKLDGAKLWDAAPGRVVASDGEQVWISSDDGNTFETVSPAKGLEIGDVFARADGLVAVEGQRDGEHVVMVRAKKGKKRGQWRELAAPAEEIVRWGAWIIAPKNYAVLSADGTEWLRQKEPEDLGHWEDYFWLIDYVVTYPKYGLPRWSATRPAAPTTADENPDTRESTRGMMGVGGGPDPCEGVECLRKRLRPADTPTRYLFLGKNMCSHERAAGPIGCEEGAPVKHDIATIALTDQRPVAIGPTPEACRDSDEPELIASVRGLGMTICQSGDATEVAVTGPGLDWTKELTASVSWGRKPMPGLMIMRPSADGTIVVVGPGDDKKESLRAWVRPPEGVGEVEKWRSWEVEGAVAYRALGDGGVMAVRVIDAAERKTLDFVVSRRGGSVETVFEGAALPSNAPFRLHVGRDGKIAAIPRCMPDTGGEPIVVDGPDADITVTCGDESKRQTQVLHSDGQWRAVD